MEKDKKKLIEAEKIDESKYVADVRFEAFGSSPGESCFSKEVAGIYTTMIPKTEEDFRRFYELITGEKGELPDDIFVKTNLRIVNKNWKSKNVVTAEEILRRFRKGEGKNEILFKD